MIPRPHGGSASPPSLPNLRPVVGNDRTSLPSSRYHGVQGLYVSHHGDVRVTLGQGVAGRVDGESR